MKTKSTLLLILLFSISGITQVNSFNLRDIDGHMIKLEDHLGNGPVLLDFWATWCKPCVKNLPKLQKTYEKYEKKGLLIFAINEDGPRSQSKVSPFIHSLGLTFPVLMDENRDVMRQFNVAGLPTTLLIDKNKKQVFSLEGYRPGDEIKLEKEIKKLIGKQ